MKYFLSFFLVFALYHTVIAQHFTHEIGFYAGASSLQADYGQRGDFATNFENRGTSLTVAHYLHFFNRNIRWNAKDKMYNYLMIKTEINYITGTELQHFGDFARANSEEGERLRAMTGTVSMTNFGVNLEYYLRNLEEFMYPFSTLKWNPYITFGGRYVIFTNTLNSTLGDWREDRTVLPEKYRPNNALRIGTSATFAATVGMGLRYKLTENMDLSALVSFQYFFSDEIDGLTSRGAENKNDERLINYQMGIVYHLNYSAPLFR